MNAIFKSALLLFFFFLSCNGGGRSSIVDSHNEAIASMKNLVPYYQKIGGIYPSVTSIRKFPNISGRTSVHTEFLVNGRYICTLYQDITYNKFSNKVVSYDGNCRFTVNELESATKLEDGRRSFRFSEQWEFGVEEIEMLNNNNWDLSLVKINMDKPPVDNFELVIESWEFAWGK